MIQYRLMVILLGWDSKAEIVRAVSKDTLYSECTGMHIISYA